MSVQKKGEGINWTETTWNPLRGCSRVSAACQSCYAEDLAYRFSGPGQPFEGLIHPVTKGWNGVIRFLPDKLAEPLQWTRPRIVFVNSVSDLFMATHHEIAAIFGVMALAGRHTFQTLTKRHVSMRAWFQWLEEKASTPEAKIAFCVNALETFVPGASKRHALPNQWPLPNVWLGVTAEDQGNADARVPELLACPAAVRWVSAEPLLGPIDFENWLDRTQAAGGGWPRLDLVVVGGESGSDARPMHPEWARQIRDACRSAGAAFHFKQWGEFIQGPNHGNPVLNDKGYAVPSVLLCTPGKHDYVRMVRVTKRKAGRLLDGVIHNDAMSGRVGCSPN